MKPYLQLMRPANIVTAVADIMAGVSLCYYVPKNASLVGGVLKSTWNLLSFPVFDLPYLILATIGLYGGGVVLNDFFDADLDKIERPERPIPSGKVSKQEAGLFGLGLLVMGVASAFKVSMLSGFIALSVALLAVLYDYKGKHYAFFAPINMGMCRGGNLLLGASIVASNVYHFWFLAFIPIVYIAAITMVSRGEVHGGNKDNLKLGLLMYAAVVISLGLLMFFYSKDFWAVPFLLLFAYFIFPPLAKAMNEPLPANIMQAVKSGVISLIILDATLVTIFANWYLGVVVLCFIFLSRHWAKTFAVT
ncbi:MAG: polyprenyltransferase [Cytophagales bacterium]|nr:MAG: polyprenyltransferase [Cytophagales bacterium]